MITYILQVSLSWAAFYAVYWLFLRKETFFQLNRFYLLASLVISLAIPYVQLPIMASETIPIAPINLVEIDIYATNTLNVTATGSSSSVFDWFHFMWWVYAVIAFGFLCRFLFNIAQIYNLFISGDKIKSKDYYLVENDLMHIPFSFFSYLFFSKKMDLLPEEKQQIIKHEEAHIQQKHSIDVLLIELLQILFWFNPIIFLYKRAIKENHEYLADQAVIQHNSKKKYGRLLLGQSNPGIRIALANNFNYSQLKNRILMMTRQQSSGKARYKFLLAVPVLLMATILFANRQSLTNNVSHNIEVVENNFDEKEIRLQLLNTLWNMKIERIQAHEKGLNKDASAAFRYLKHYNELIEAHPKHIKKIQSIASELADKYGFELTFSGNNIQGSYFRDPIEKVIANLPKVDKEEAPKTSSQTNGNPPPPPPPPYTRELMEAQKIKNGFDEIIDIVEEMPYMKECEGIADKQARKKCSDKAVMTFILKHLKYPAEARKNGIEGMAVVSFTIEKDGTPTNFKLSRNPGAGTGEEALRIVSMLPQWVPGKQRGKVVKVQYHIPVRFKLEKEEAKPSKPKQLSAPIKAVKSDGDVYRIVEQMPRMKGCEHLSTIEEKKTCSDKKILNFIQQNLRYPKTAKEQGAEGMAVIKFIVEKDGSISSASILRNPGEGTGEEALRVVSSMPDWNPGIQSGKPVRVQFFLPVRFKLTPQKKEKPIEGTEKKLELSAFKLFPNPSSSSINVEFQSKIDSPVYLKVVDISGKVLWSAKETSFNGSMNKTIDLGVAPGNYHLIIEQDGRSVSKSFVIQR